METSKTIKGLLAGVVLASGLMVSTPLAPTVVEAATYYDYAGKPLDLKSIEFGTFEEMKDFAVELYEDPEFDPGAYLVYTKEDYTKAFLSYVNTTQDITQDYVTGKYMGRVPGISVREITKGVYETIINIDSNLNKDEASILNNKLDKAEKFIVDNYSLKTEYEVVHAINKFISSQIDYNKSIKRNHPYLLEGMNTTCWGYTKIAQNLYGRFGITNRIVSGKLTGGGHAWGAVKMGQEWYYTDSTGVDQPNYFEEGYLIMTQNSVDTKGYESNTTFKASNKAFDKTKSVAYAYKAVKAAQAKK